MPTPNPTTPDYYRPEIAQDPTETLGLRYGPVESEPSPASDPLIRPEPDPSPRPALYRIAQPLRAFGQWLRQPNAGAHNVVVQNHFIAHDPTLPFYTEVPAVNSPACWSTPARGSY